MPKPDLPPFDKALIQLIYAVGALWVLFIPLAILSDGRRAGYLPRPEDVIDAMIAVWVCSVLALVTLAVRAARRPGPFPPDAEVAIRFRENWASGRSLRTWWTRFSSANNCLQVTLTDAELWTRFNGPFRYMAVVNDFGLENRIPLDRILRVEKTGWEALRVIIDYRDEQGTTCRLELGLRHGFEFVSTLRALWPAVTTS